MKTGILYPSLNAMPPLASDAVVSTVLRTFLCLAFVFTAGASVAQENRPAPQDPAQSAESDELAEPSPSESPGQSEQAGTESTRPPDEPAIVMEEVVVTARKRAQPAFEVPLSLSTIQEAKSTALRASGMDLRFLSNRVPSLQLESSYGRVFPRIYIRGLGNTDFDLNASQPVSVVYDGI
ncbi:MAG: hypothetical protein OXI19_10060, partial [Gemmatimonadota bacterium]|nr:hypothetical protein [Gemmatimonadota bacterium]